MIVCHWTEELLHRSQLPNSRSGQVARLAGRVICQGIKEGRPIVKKTTRNDLSDATIFSTRFALLLAMPNDRAQFQEHSSRA